MAAPWTPASPSLLFRVSGWADVLIECVVRLQVRPARLQGRDGVVDDFTRRKQHRMQPQTIVHRVARNKSFVYGQPYWVEDAPRPTIKVPIRPRANGKPVCSDCGWRRSGYDRLPPRRVEFIPLI